MLGLQLNDLLVQSTGSATIIEGRYLVFPNGWQHKMESFEQEDPTKSGAQKILTFFLLDPEKKTLSTAPIPPQQHEWLSEAREPNLKKMRMAQSKIPVHLHGMSLYEARKRRLELLAARSLSPNPEDRDWFYLQREYD